MKLITTEEQLRAHIPHVVATVKGETPLLQKFTVFLNQSEQYVIDTFLSDKTFNTICKYADDNPIKLATARLVVADAMLRAIPSLDLVLTPNGYAIVSTSNLAPASKPRIDRLMRSMDMAVDACIISLLPMLPGASQWLSSEQAAYFGATLFPSVTMVDAVGTTTGSKWLRYVELHPTIVDLEAALAEEFFSPELMQTLRQARLRNTSTPEQQTVIKHIQAQIIAFLKDKPIDRRRMADIVNYIRLRPESFPEWHASATAQLFAPPIFENKKNAPGYFFQ